MSSPMARDTTPALEIDAADAVFVQVWVVASRKNPFMTSQT